MEDRVWDMLVNCWAADPAVRPTATGIISNLESFGIPVPSASGPLNKAHNLDFPSFLLERTELLAKQVRLVALIHVNKKYTDRPEGWFSGDALLARTSSC